MDHRQGKAHRDRRVDQRLKFQTRSLLCVPLRGRTGELFGAFEVLNKVGGNFTDDDEQTLSELATHAAAALENTQQWEQLLAAQRQIADTAEQGVRLIGECPKIQALRSTISRVADTELAVLVLGENGTGKEVVAQMIHYKSRRRQEPLVAVNCAAIAETLLESELFGHEKGAFTGAIATKIGRFELADKGTLFLDEVGEIPLELQVKLLRVLQEQEFERLGSTRTIRVNVRVVAATNRDLPQMVEEQRFRSDLYYRLKVFPITIPSLRDRTSDIPLLVRYFTQKFAVRMKKRIEAVPVETMKALQAYPWPGNVRELENSIERAVILSSGTDLFVPLSELKRPDVSVTTVATTTLEQAERDHILKVLRDTKWVIGGAAGAAAKLGMKRTTLQSKMQKLGIARPS